MTHITAAVTSLIRFRIAVTCIVMVIPGCSKPGPVTVDPPADQPRVGNRILYSANYGDGTFGIDWCEYDGSRRQTLLKPHWVLVSQPRGGRFVAMRYSGTDSLGAKDSLFVVNIADRRQTLIGVFNGYPADNGILSPDGLKVLLVSGELPTKLTIANVDGTGRQTIVSDAYVMVEPSFSPDGRMIAYAREGRDWDRASLHVVGADGTNDHEIVDSLNIKDGNRVSWSPDGRRIAYTGFDGRQSTVSVVNADGSDRRHLTDGGQNDFDPAWSPDGLQIAFTTSPHFTSRKEIAVINVDGSDRQDVTATPDEHEGNAQWSPDNRRLLLSSSRVSVPASLRVLGLSSGTMTTIDSAMTGQGYWDYSSR